MVKTICIGAGHGGIDAGACNGNRMEKDDNLQLSSLLGNLLKSRGYNVVFTRIKDITVTPSQRRQIAINVKADFYIDLHRNSHTDNTAKGIEIWIRDIKYSQAAADVMTELSKVENQANRGIKIGDFAVLYNMPMPAILIELGFISNTQDNILYDKYFENNATAISKGILLALNEPYSEISNSNEAKQYAYIQLGKYTWPDNEKGLRSEIARIKAAGIECFPVIPTDVKENEK